MKVGVIGLGSIGLRHALNLKDHGYEVVVFDPALDKDSEDDWKRRDLAKRNGYIIESDREHLFRDVDAVVSATPSEQHVNDLRSAIEYGVPILVEKPIATAMTPALRDLLAEAKHDDLPVMVGYNLRFHACVIKAKAWLDQGLIGQPLWASFTCAQLNDKYRHDGVILSWSHEIDLARYLLGPAKVICATARVCNGHDDIADLVLEHEDGARSNIHLDYVTAPSMRTFHIVGSKGRIIAFLDDSGLRYAVRQASDASIPEVCTFPYESFDRDYVTELKAFLRRAEGKPAFGATGADGLAVLDLCVTARQLAGLT
jgi:predicted dehydrogenase